MQFTWADATFRKRRGIKSKDRQLGGHIRNKRGESIPNGRDAGKKRQDAHEREDADERRTLNPS